jgi:hypothetical protein
MRLSAVALSFVLATTLVACGDDEKDSTGHGDYAHKSAEQIRKDVDFTMAGVGSLRMVGESDGFTFNASADRDGECVASVTVGDGSADTPAHGRQMNEQAGGKWVRTPRSMGYFAPFCDLDELLDQVLAGDPTMAEKGEETDVEGQRAIALTADVSGGGTSTMWVASDAPHHLLKIETVGGDDPGVFTFSGYDEPVDVPIPPAEEVIDLGKVKAAK